MKLCEIRSGVISLSCHCRGPDEARYDKRQPSCFKSRNSVASAIDPMKLSRLKGNHSTSEARIQLPPPLMRRCSPSSKATIVPQKQEFSYFCLTPKKHSWLKTQNCAKLGFCVPHVKRDSSRFVSEQKILTGYIAISDISINLVQCLVNIVWIIHHA